MGSWYKGGITTSLCNFIEAQLGSGQSGIEMLDLCGEAAVAINTALRGLYTEDVWIPASRACELGEYGMRFLRRYSALGRKAMDLGKALFVILPKQHALQHVFLQDLYLTSQHHTFVVNPLCYSVQLSEDMIGQLSHLSRRVDPRTCARRCIQRYLKSV